jgi:hypothetical protein
MDTHAHGRWGASRARFGEATEWQDRVAGVDEPRDHDVHVDELLRDALDAARTAVECAGAPIAAFAEGLPEMMGGEFRYCGWHWRRAWRRASEDRAR